MKEKKALEAYEIIQYPVITEKAIGMIESENKLTFVVHNNSDKNEVKNAIEELYKIKVDKINILNDRKGKKRAIVKINKKFKADDVATKLGVI